MVNETETNSSDVETVSTASEAPKEILEDAPEAVSDFDQCFAKDPLFRKGVEEAELEIAAKQTADAIASEAAQIERQELAKARAAEAKQRAETTEQERRDELELLQRQEEAAG